MRRISALDTIQASRIDLILTAAEMKTMEMQDGKRKFYRFHASRHYGGIVRDDPVGCPFLSAYCWRYERNEPLGRYWVFYSVDDVIGKLSLIACTKKIRLFRMNGVNSKSSKYSLISLKQLICAGVDTYPAVMGDSLEQRGPSG